METTNTHDSITDLKEIKIDTAQNNGTTKFTIWLKSNHLKVATIWCRKRTVTKVWHNDDFFNYYEQARIDSVLHEFLAWNRMRDPQHKLPPHSGRTKTGETHPWRKPKRRTARPPREFEEPVEPVETDGL